MLFYFNLSMFVQNENNRPFSNNNYPGFVQKSFDNDFARYLHKHIYIF